MYGAALIRLARRVEQCAGGTRSARTAVRPAFAFYGASESLVRSIFYPFTVDQPTNTFVTAAQHHAAFELLSMQT
jgi:hypothetical protein